MLADCPICQRANKKRKQHRSRHGEGHLDAKNFGDIVTMDFVSSYSDRIPGLGELKGDDEALVVVDVATEYAATYPFKKKPDSLQVAMCIHKFKGSKFIKRIYSDGAGELVDACNRWGIVHEASIPGRPESNGVIERFIGRLSRGARSLLSASGLPVNFWALAASAWCHGHNLQSKKDGTNPWN